MPTIVRAGETVNIGNVLLNPIEEPVELFACMTRFVHELKDKSLELTQVFGKIGGLSASATKGGAAGVEATFHFATPSNRIVVEVLGWFEYNKLVTGITIYDYNKSPSLQYDRTVELSNPQEMLSYEVARHTASGIHTRIRNSSGNVIFDDMYSCAITKITRFQTELEYWRSLKSGSFNFDGMVTLERGYGEETGYIALGPACNYYKDISHSQYPCLEFHICNHYVSNGAWVMEGSIRES